MKRSMRGMGFGWVLLAAVLGLGGCVTGYQKGGIGGGYWDKDLSAGVFEVHFQASGRSFGWVKNAAYYHAAEMTYDHQYRYFRALKMEDESQTIWVPNGGPVQPTTSSIPQVKLTIQCYTQRPAEACYDAYQYLNAVKVPGTDAPYTIDQRKADQLAGKYNP